MVEYDGEADDCAFDGEEAMITVVVLMSFSVAVTVTVMKPCRAFGEACGVEIVELGAAAGAVVLGLWVFDGTAAGAVEEAGGTVEAADTYVLVPATPVSTGPRLSAVVIGGAVGLTRNDVLSWASIATELRLVPVTCAELKGPADGTGLATRSMSIH